jgi:ABC-type phosphate/phosphonate transport system substrate-binding protein
MGLEANERRSIAIYWNKCLLLMESVLRKLAMRSIPELPPCAPGPARRHPRRRSLRAIIGSHLRRVLITLACLCLVWQTASATQPSPLRLGVLPAQPPSVLLREFAPLERYLERELGRDVLIVSAPDYTELMQRTLAQAYDLLFVPPHLGLLAIEQGRWQPLVRDDLASQATLIVRAGSSLRSLADLRGKMIAVPDVLAIVTLITELELERASLPPAGAVTLIYLPNHASVILMVRQGLADAGAVSSVLLERLPSRERRDLRVLHKFKQKFDLVYLASPTTSPSQLQRLRTALERFPASQEGLEYFAQEPGTRLLPLVAKDLVNYRALLPLTIERLYRERG